MEVVKTEEREDEGLKALFGKVITVYCCRYIYTGKLVGVNDTCIKLEDPKIVYDTGAHDKKDWTNAQALPEKHFYVATAAIESFGVFK